MSVELVTLPLGVRVHVRAFQIFVQIIHRHLLFVTVLAVKTAHTRMRLVKFRKSFVVREPNVPRVLELRASFRLLTHEVANRLDLPDMFRFVLFGIHYTV